MDGDLEPRPGPLRDRHIVVIGGGITGLAAAYEITRLAPSVRVTLLEASHRLGGKIGTEQVDGFTIEAGPDSFLSAKPRGVGLFQELGIEDHLQGVTVQKDRAYILLNDAMHPIPEGLTGLVPTRLGPLSQSSLLSWPGKVRVALDYVLPPRRDDADESVGHFVRRRLGDQAWERLVEPLMAGIYAANGDELSLNATFPQLRKAEVEHGGLIRGVLAARQSTPAASSPKSPFLSPKGGMGELVAALEQRLHTAGASIQLNTTALDISPLSLGTGRRAGGEGLQPNYRVLLEYGQKIEADAIILATPAHATAPLLANIAPDVAQDLTAIPHASTAIVSLAYRRQEIPHPLASHGYVVPRVAGGAILAGTWSSRKWANRAPEGWELLRVFIGRSGQDGDLMAADDDALIALARTEVRTRLGVEAPPGLSRVQRWPLGMPQYVLGHPERIARIEAAMHNHPGLALAGNAYRGVGIPDCIASGEAAARAILPVLLAATSSAATGEQSTTPNSQERD